MPFVIKKLHAPLRQKAFLFLIRELGFTQKEAQRLIAKGRLFINGTPVSDTAAYVEGDFEFVVFEPHTKGLEPLFITPDFVIYDKPSGLLIHPQNRHTPYSLIDELKHRYGPNANITHRIDQETSGLVLCARNKVSERDLKTMFESRRIHKSYIAFVHGLIKNEIFIDAPLLRREDESAVVRMVVKVHADGKSSQTVITPLKQFPELGMTLVEAKPLTGRQHQIRVHLFHVKHPIVGDPIYGQSSDDIVRFLDKEITPKERLEKSGATRLLLHANHLMFEYGASYCIYSKSDFIEEAKKAMKL